MARTSHSSVTARGGLNAVYEFLETQVGIRWPEPSREFVPKLNSLELRLDRVHNPRIRLSRHITRSQASKDNSFLIPIVDWVAKNRLNTIQFSCETYELVRPRILDSVLDRGTMMKVGGHSRKYFYPEEEYFSKHPDHFALVKGKRTGETQFCYSNHDSVAEYVKNIVAYLKMRPEIGIAPLWPSDGYGFCECENCKSKPTTDVLLDYINDAAQRIAQSCRK